MNNMSRGSVLVMAAVLTACAAPRETKEPVGSLSPADAQAPQEQDARIHRDEAARDRAQPRPVAPSPTLMEREMKTVAQASRAYSAPAPMIL